VLNEILRTVAVGRLLVLLVAFTVVK